MHVLIVERDPFVRAWWKSQNEDMRIELEFVSNLGAAREALRKTSEKTRCVIADAGSLIFDAQGGDRLVRRLSSLEVPVITYSSSAKWTSLARIVGNHLNGMLERPFTLNDALAAISAIHLAPQPAKKSIPSRNFSLSPATALSSSL